jgi:hypothetical protein
MSQLITPSAVENLKQAGLQLPQEDIPTQHFIFNGVYIRQTFIRAGIVFVGRKHKVEHCFMVLKGSAEVTVDGCVNKLVSGMTLLCKPGARRAGITLENTVFAGVYRTDKTSIKEIEEEIIEFDPTCPYDENNQVIPQLHKAIRSGQIQNRDQWEKACGEVYERERQQEAAWYGLT